MNPPPRRALLWLASVLSAVTLVEAAPSPTTKQDAPSDKRREAAARLKGDFNSVEQFDRAAAEAAKAGVPPIAIAEAKLVFCCVNEKAAALPSLLKELEGLLDGWKETDSLYFRSRLELEGLMAYARALVAEDANDETQFEAGIKEAFWRAPDAAQLFQRKLIAHRDKARLSTITVPMELKLTTSAGEATSLAAFAKGQKAVLIDFWASWCQPCMALMPELQERAQKLAPLNIRVIAMNTDSAGASDLNAAKAKAEKVRKDKRMSLPWVIEPSEQPFSRLLNIESIPRAVLLSPDGKVLYNGHPSDPALGAALEKLGVQLTSASAPAQSIAP